MVITSSKQHRQYTRGLPITEVEFFNIKNDIQQYFQINNNINFFQLAKLIKFDRRTIIKVHNSPDFNFYCKPYGRPKFSSRKNNPLIHAFLISALNYNPTFYLYELQILVQDFFGEFISLSYLCRILKSEIKYFRKRISQIAIYRNQPRIKAWRAAFKAVISQMDPMQLIFIDELHFNYTNICRNYGRGLRGEPIELYQQFVSKKSYSLLAAINIFGSVYYELYDTQNQAIDGDIFSDYLTNLLPRTPQSAIIILDNARIHVTEQVQELINNSNRTILFSSAYSPDFSPIELVFSWIKINLKKHNYDGIAIEDLIHYYMELLDEKIVIGYYALCASR